MLASQIIGATEIVNFPEFNWLRVQARVDTGARTSAMHCARVVLEKKEGRPLLNFWLTVDAGREPVGFSTFDFQEREVKSSFGTVEKRFAIKTLVVINGRRFRGSFTLSNRDNMVYPVLIGRNFLKGRFLVDASVNKVKPSKA
ncbi:ATP-dependent zinc protease [Ravibacter arvi]|uniref:ATP-dependent zinc protease n=1 Tax=Ravibacter arvi TaxID=2051041 RepID=A0ABP8M1B7_9BACT